MKKLALTVAVAVATVASSGMRCEAQSMINSILEGLTKHPRSIHTQGIAAVDVVPDEVVITFGVKTFNASLPKSSDENNAMTKELLALAKHYGIEGSAIQTSSIKVDDMHKNNDDSSKVIGYQVNRTVTMDVKDISKVEGLLADAIKNGANSISDMEFKTTQLRKYRDQARADAAKAALEKANALAQTLGVSVGKVQTISDVAEPDYLHTYAQNNLNLNVFPPSPIGIEGSVFAAGKITVKSMVDVTWELE